MLPKNIRTQVIVEISGQEKKVEAFIDLMRPFGIVELVRTGRIAMVRSVGGRQRNGASIRPVTEEQSAQESA
jgi:acetolactate synthase I/III small subunit